MLVTSERNKVLCPSRPFQYATHCVTYWALRVLPPCVRPRCLLAKVLDLQENSGIFSYRIGRDDMSQTPEERIVYRARGTGTGWAFSPKDFADFGGPSTIDIALHRLAQKGKVRRVIRGIYDYPRFSEFLGQQLGPDIDQVARAAARKFRWRHSARRAIMGSVFVAFSAGI